MPERKVNASLYQSRVLEEFKHIFGEDNVKKEWDVARDSMDDYSRKLYCPRIDVAVGPFNIERNIYRDNRRINNAILTYKWLIERLVENSETDIGTTEDFLYAKNKNPRCF